MKHSLTLEFESADELAAYLAASGSVTDAPAKPKTAGSPRNKAPEAEPEVEEEDVTEGITYEEVSALVVRVSKEKGRDTAINFLKTFKNPANKKPATKGAEIAPADYPRAKAEAEALLAEEEDVS